MVPIAKCVCLCLSSLAIRCLPCKAKGMYHMLSSGDSARADTYFSGPSPPWTHHKEWETMCQSTTLDITTIRWLAQLPIAPSRTTTNPSNKSQIKVRPTYCAHDIPANLTSTTTSAKLAAGPGSKVQTLPPYLSALPPVHTKRYRYATEPQRGKNYSQIPVPVPVPGIEPHLTSCRGGGSSYVSPLKPPPRVGRAFYDRMGRV